MRAKGAGKGIAVEDLDFRDDKSITAKFNRISHGFVWSKFLNSVERGCLREGVPFIKVKPPYSSLIGILKYQSQYGISNHEAAGYVIGRRALLFLKFLTKKQSKRFYEQTNWKQWSLVQKRIIKQLNSKKKEVNSLVSWQHLRKNCLAEVTLT